MARRSLPIFDFDVQDNPNGAIKSFHGSVKRSSSSSPGNLNAKRAKRTVLEDMIFNGKIPPTVLIARENDERINNLKGKLGTLFL